MPSECKPADKWGYLSLSKRKESNEVYTQDHASPSPTAPNRPGRGHLVAIVGVGYYTFITPAVTVLIRIEDNSTKSFKHVGILLFTFPLGVRIRVLRP